MLATLFQSPRDFVLLISGLLIAITVHEFAHAWMANKLGDPTAQLEGRLSLNPLRHLDPLGTIMLIVIGFGWGKPVNFDPYNLANPRKDSSLISLAGPTSNIVLAIILSLLLKYFLPASFSVPIYSLIYINLVLAIFNLVPVYPLDGEKILTGFLPKNLAFEFQTTMRRYGTIILLFLVLPIFGQSPIISLIKPIIGFLFSLLT